MTDQQEPTTVTATLAEHVLSLASWAAHTPGAHLEVAEGDGADATALTALTVRAADVTDAAAARRAEGDGVPAPLVGVTADELTAAVQVLELTMEKARDLVSRARALDAERRSREVQESGRRLSRQVAGGDLACLGLSFDAGRAAWMVPGTRWLVRPTDLPSRTGMFHAPVARVEVYTVATDADAAPSTAPSAGPGPELAPVEAGEEVKIGDFDLFEGGSCALGSWSGLGYSVPGDLTHALDAWLRSLTGNDPWLEAGAYSRSPAEKLGALLGEALADPGSTLTWARSRAAWQSAVLALRDAREVERTEWLALSRSKDRIPNGPLKAWLRENSYLIHDSTGYATSGSQVVVEQIEGRVRPAFLDRDARSSSKGLERIHWVIRLRYGDHRGRVSTGSRHTFSLRQANSLTEALPGCVVRMPESGDAIFVAVNAPERVAALEAALVEWVLVGPDA